MLERLQAAELEPWDGILSLGLSVIVLDKLFLVFLEETETPDHHHINEAKCTKLLSLVDEPRENESDEDQEGIASRSHDNRQMDRVEEDEGEKEGQD